MGMTGSVLLAGCARGWGDPAEEPEPEPEPDPEPEPEPEPTVLAVCVCTDPATLDPALISTVGEATIASHLFSGLARWGVGEDGGRRVVPDLATELPEPVINEDGSATYTYTLREGCTWSDGRPLVASDFVFSWNRVAELGPWSSSASPLSIIRGFDAMHAPKGETPEATEDASEGEPTEAGKPDVEPDGEPVEESAPEDASSPQTDEAEAAEGDEADGQGTEEDQHPADDAVAQLAVLAPDDLTLVVTLEHPIPVWDELLALPCLLPVREDVVADVRWAEDPSSLVSNGAFSMVGWEHGSVISLERRQDHPDADLVTLQGIEFFFSDELGNRISNFRRGTWDLVDVTRHEDISALAREFPHELATDDLLGTFVAYWDVNSDLLPGASQLEGADAEHARAQVRHALMLLADRSRMVSELAQAGQVPAASLVPRGILDADGSEFCANAGREDGFSGYIDVSDDAFESNYEAAMGILREWYDYDEGSGYLTNVPPITLMRQTGGEASVVEEYLRDVLAQVGIKVRLSSGGDLPLIPLQQADGCTTTLAEIVCPYADPLAFLGMWTSLSAQNLAHLGQGAHAEVAAYSIDLTDLGFEDKVEEGTWAQTYDRVFELATNVSDRARRYELMHRAEDLLMETGAICPFYFCTSASLVDPMLTGCLVNPQGVRYFHRCAFVGM